MDLGLLRDAAGKAPAPPACPLESAERAPWLLESKALHNNTGLAGHRGQKALGLRRDRRRRAPAGAARGRSCSFLSNKSRESKARRESSGLGPPSVCPSSGSPRSRSFRIRQEVEGFVPAKLEELHTHGSRIAAEDLQRRELVDRMPLYPQSLPSLSALSVFSGGAHGVGLAAAGLPEHEEQPHAARTRRLDDRSSGLAKPRPLQAPPAASQPRRHLLVDAEVAGRGTLAFWRAGRRPWPPLAFCCGRRLRRRGRSRRCDALHTESSTLSSKLKQIESSSCAQNSHNCSKSVFKSASNMQLCRITCSWETETTSLAGVCVRHMNVSAGASQLLSASQNRQLLLSRRAAKSSCLGFEFSCQCTPKQSTNPFPCCPGCSRSSSKNGRTRTKTSGPNGIRMP